MWAFIRLSTRSGSWRLELQNFSVPEEDRMNIHKNARLTPIGRERIVMQVECGQTPQAAARAAGVCPRTARKWVARYRAEGLAGLRDLSSRPRTFHRPTQLLVVDEIIALRRQRLPGKHSARKAHRHARRRVARDRQPRAETRRSEPHEGP